MDWHGRKREEMAEQQERRPPVYNSEDYVAGLKKFCKLTGLQLYLGEEEEEELQNGSKITIKTNTPLSQSGRPTEMGLRQFSNISELLAKLKGDLNLSFPSFIREFIGSSNDGVTLLLEALKAIQLSQSNITGSLNQLGSRANHVMFKRALNDEFETLVCLKICSRSDDGVQRLAEHPSGLFTIAVCVMSNYSKSRVLSLQLLARLCDAQGGHKQVSDSISMLRLRFGEPVRFKFLVGMLNSYNSSAFQISCLRFLNRFIETSKDSREKIMIQTELEEAGFDTSPLKKLISNNSVSRSDLLKEELNRWSQNYVDVNSLVKKLLDAERANRKLREEITLLKEKNRHIENEREELKTSYSRLQSELNDNAVLKFEMNDNVKFPVYDVQEDTAVHLRQPSSLVTILNSNVVTEDNRTIITCSSSSSSNSPKIVPDSGLSSNSSTHEETKSLSDESSSHQKEASTEEEDAGVSNPEGEHIPESSSSEKNIRVNVKKTISKFNREAALRNRCDPGTNRVDRIVGETIPNSTTRTPSPPPRCIGETIKAGDVDSFGVPLQTPNPPCRSRRTKSNSNLGHHNEVHQDTKSFKNDWNIGKSHNLLSSMSSDESSDEKEELFFEGDPAGCGKSNDNTLETVSARSFGCFVRPNDSSGGVKRHKSFFNGSKPRTRHGKPKDVMRRSESFHHQGRSYSVERLSDDPFHPNNFQRHLSAANAGAPPKKSSLSKSKSMEFLKAKLLSRKPSSVKSKTTNKQSNSASSQSNSNLCQQHPSFWSALPSSPSYRSSDVILNRENSSSRSYNYDWRQDTPFWNNKRNNGAPPPPPPTAPPPPPLEDWLPGSPAFRNGWMMQGGGGPHRKFPMPSLFQPGDYRHTHQQQQPASYAFEETSTTDLADRLEITELTDEEPDIPSPDYGGGGNGGCHNINGSFSSLKSGNSNKVGNILDMPSGLY